MLGKTHIVNSLALLNLGFVGYAAYTARTPVLPDGSAPKSISLFDLNLTGPMTILEYVLFLVVVLCFTLFIFRKPSRKKKHKEKFFYVLSMLLSLFVLFVVFPSHFVFKLSLSVLCFIMGVLLVDIDSKDSTLGRYLMPLSEVIPHRKVTHTVWVLILLFGLGWYFKNGYVLMLAIGYTVHMIQDTFSACGLCWFYPIFGKYQEYGGGAMVKKGHNKMPSYAVGGLVETIIFWVSVALIAGSVGYYFYMLVVELLKNL